MPSLSPQFEPLEHRCYANGASPAPGWSSLFDFPEIIIIMFHNTTFVSTLLIMDPIKAERTLFFPNLGSKIMITQPWNRKYEEAFSELNLIYLLIYGLNSVILIIYSFYTLLTKLNIYELQSKLVDISAKFTSPPRLRVLRDDTANNK